MEGKTVYVAAGKYTEFDEPILRLEKDWLGVENARMFRRGQKSDYVTNTEAETCTGNCADTVEDPVPIGVKRKRLFWSLSRRPLSIQGDMILEFVHRRP